MKYNLLNISTLLADNTAKTRYDLITGGTDTVQRIRIVGLSIWVENSAITQGAAMTWHDTLP